MSHWHDLERYRKANSTRLYSEIDQSIARNQQLIRKMRLHKALRFIDTIVWRAISLEFLFSAFRNHHSNSSNQED